MGITGCSYFRTDLEKFYCKFIIHMVYCKYKKGNHRSGYPQWFLANF